MAVESGPFLAARCGRVYGSPNVCGSAPPVSDLGSDLQGGRHLGVGPDSGRVRQQLAPESDAADKDEKKSQMNIT